MNKDLRQNFKYPHIPETAYHFGQEKFLAVPLREDGDWRNFLPPYESQKINGVEASYCYVEASQHAVAAIQEEQFELADQNYSARFNALLSDGTPSGGDPLVAGDSCRNDGLIPDYLMPFDEGITSWDELHSWKGSKENECRNIGKQFIGKWKLNYDIVFTKDTPLKVKYDKLREALTYSPCPLSLYGKVDKDGNYVEKPEGVSDTHLLLAVYVDSDNVIWCMDTYSPFLKQLPANYNPDFCMRWAVNRIETVKAKKKSFWQTIINIFFREKIIFREFKKFWLINKMR